MYDHQGNTQVAKRFKTFNFSVHKASQTNET